jgi:hypothetical protein
MADCGRLAVYDLWEERARWSAVCVLMHHEA